MGFASSAAMVAVSTVSPDWHLRVAGGIVVLLSAWLYVPRLLMLLALVRTVDAEWRLSGKTLERRLSSRIDVFDSTSRPGPRRFSIMGGRSTQFGSGRRKTLIDRRLLVPSSDYIPIEERRANRAGNVESVMLSGDGEFGEMERVLPGDAR